MPKDISPETIQNIEDIVRALNEHQKNKQTFPEKESSDVLVSPSELKTTREDLREIYDLPDEAIEADKGASDA